jgi:hypothetical protein
MVFYVLLNGAVLVGVVVLKSAGCAHMLYAVSD